MPCSSPANRSTIRSASGGPSVASLPPRLPARLLDRVVPVSLCLALLLILNGIILPLPIAAASCSDYGAQMRWVGSSSSLELAGVASDVAVAGIYAYVAVGPRRAGSSESGLRVVTVLDPAYPHVVGRVDTPNPAGDVAVTGNRAYVVSYPGIVVIDILLPPRIIQTVDTSGASAVAIAGGHVYAAAGESGLLVFEVSPSGTLDLVGRVDTPGNAQGVAVTGEYAYVGDGTSGVHVIDISDPALPTVVGSTETPGIAREVAAYGSHVVVADDSSVLVVDVRDPTSPAVVGSVSTPGPTSTVAVSGSHAFAPFGAPGGTLSIDISDPASPVVVGRVDAGWSGVAVGGDLLYLANGSAGLGIVDITHPTSPLVAGTDTGRSNAVVVRDALAYIGAGLGFGEFLTVDVSDPGMPTVMGRVWTSVQVVDLVVSGDLAYLAEGVNYFPGPGEGAFQVIDTSDPHEPRIVGSLATHPSTYGVAVAGSHAYIVEGGALRSIDVSDPASPRIVGGLEGLGALGAIALRGSHAFVAGWHNGLQVIDVSDPASPVIVGNLSTVIGSDAEISGDFIYVVGGQLDVVSILDPTAPALAGSVDLDYGYDVAVSGNYAYVADLHDLRVIDVSDPTSPVVLGGSDALEGPVGVAVADSFVCVAGWNGFSTLPLQCGDPVPVLMSDLEAEPVADGIRVGWWAERSHFASFRLLRALGRDPETEAFTALTREPLPATRTPLVYLDRDVLPGKSYAYKVNGLMRNGTIETLGPVVATASATSDEPAFLSISTVPNPAASGETTIVFDLPLAGRAEIEIHDVSGRLVRRLVDGHLLAGRHLTVWDGCNERGQRVACGVYLLHLSSEGASVARPVTLVR